MKKKVMNIRPQEVVTDGERSVQYKGSDGKFHGIAAGNNETDGTSSAESVMIVNIKRVNGEIECNHNYADIVSAIENGKGVVINFIDGEGLVRNYNCGFMYYEGGSIGLTNCMVDVYIEPDSIRVKD